MFIITDVTKNFTTRYKRFSKPETFAALLGVRPTATIYADASDCSKEDMWKHYITDSMVSHVLIWINILKHCFGLQYVKKEYNL